MATKTTFVSKTSKTSAASAASGLLLVAVIALSGCTPRPEGPGPTAEKFFGALAIGDTATAAQLSDIPNEAREALNAAWAGLQATHLDAQMLTSKYAEDTGTVAYRFTWHLPKNRTWSYDGQLKMARDEGHWEVRWATTGLHPQLGEHQTFALRADLPRRASVNELGGSDVLAPGYLYHYTLDASQAGPALIGTVHAIVDVLRPFNDALNDPQLLAEQASSATQPVDLATLHPDDNDKVFPAIGRLPGIVVTPQAAILPTDPHFAPAVMGQVKKAVMDQLDGQAGWRVVRSRSLRKAGNAMDEAIMQAARTELGLIISQRAARHIKMTLGVTGGGEGFSEVVGLDVAKRTPRSEFVFGGLVATALEPIVSAIAGAVYEMLSEIPAGLAEDVVRGKVRLAGGGALLPGLASRIETTAGIGAVVVEDPLRCVVRGAAEMLERKDTDKGKHSVPGLRQ